MQFPSLYILIVVIIFLVSHHICGVYQPSFFSIFLISQKRVAFHVVFLFLFFNKLLDLFPIHILLWEQRVYISFVIFRTRG